MDKTVTLLRYDDELTELKQARNDLSQYNIWRKGYCRTRPSEREIGIAIDVAIGCMDDILAYNKEDISKESLFAENVRLRAILAQHGITLEDKNENPVQNKTITKEKNTWVGTTSKSIKKRTRKTSSSE